MSNSTITIKILGEAPRSAERRDRGEGPPALSGADTWTGIAARTHGPGDALLYYDADGAEVHELRDLDETLSIARQLAKGVTLQLGHGGKVIGRTTGARVEGGKVVADLLITDAATRRGLLDGTGARELSLGYYATTDADNYQRGIRVDHLALVETARCGSVCAVSVPTRTDCAGGCSCKPITSAVMDTAYWEARSDAIDRERLTDARVRIPENASRTWLRSAIAALDARATFNADVAEAERVIAGVATSPKSVSARDQYIARIRSASKPKETP